MTNERNLRTPTNEDLLEWIYAYLARTGMGETTLGKRLCNDFNLVRELEAGRDVRLTLARKIEVMCRE